MAAIENLRHDALFDGKTSVITGDGDFHNASSLRRFSITVANRRATR
jgi:hypothetical protein